MRTLQSIMRADHLEKMLVAKIVARSVGKVGLAALVAAGAGCGDPNPQGPSPVAAGRTAVGATTPVAPRSASVDAPAEPSRANRTSAVVPRSASVDAPAEPNRANRASAVDATTLKADPPVVQSPKDGSETESVHVTLIIKNARPKYLPAAPFRYRFALHEGDAGAGASIEETLVDQGTGDTTRHAVGRALRQGRRHSWRVRAEIDARSGPWSEWEVFRTPILPPIVGSPKDRVEISGSAVTLIITHAPGSARDAALRYRFVLHEGNAGAGASIATALVKQGTGDATRHTVGRTLRPGRIHSWRARAVVDGRDGPWSAWASFRTSSKRLDPPTLESPINGATITNPRGPLSVSNGAVLRPDGRVIYEFEVDDNSAFSSPLKTRAARTGGPGAGGRTVRSLEQDLAPGKTYHWRVRARDDTDTGRWSNVQTFKVAERPRGGRADEIDASSVRYLHRNIADWQITSTVTNITISGSRICVYHTGAGRFPRSRLGTPPDDIAIEGNVWVFGRFGNRWHGATWDWLRPGQECKAESTGALGPEQIRIPPMDHTWRPRSGETLCFAMSARARDNVQAGRVRSNIACKVVP